MKIDYFSKGLRLVRMLNFDLEAKLGPIRVDIAATSACNYHCLFCGTHSYLLKQQPEPRYMNESILKRLLSDLKDLGTMEVLFAGNGEPLLSIPLLNLIRRNDYGLRFEIMTNGSLLDRITSDLFSKLSKITVSLNSGNGKSHQLTHGYQGANQFSEIKRNIQRLLDHLGGPKKIELNYVITKDNRDETDEFIIMAENWGVKYHIRPMDDAPFREPNVAISKQLYPCYIGFIQPYITVNGSVLPCCGYGKKPLGDLNCQSFKQIWQDHHNQEIRFNAAIMDRTQKPIGPNCYVCANGLASSALFHKIYSRIPILGKV